MSLTQSGEYLEITVTMAELQAICDREIDRMHDLIEKGEREGLITKVEREADPEFQVMTLRLYGELPKINSLMSTRVEPSRS